MSQNKSKSRVNGAKSKGPITPEGKQKSSRNSLRHGLTAEHTILLECENAVEFSRMRQKFYDDWKPVNFTEQCIVENMLKTQWRLLRIEAMEIAHMDIEHDRRFAAVAKNFNNPDALVVTTVNFFRSCDKSRAHALLYRYHVRYSREFRAWMNALVQLRAAQPKQDPDPSPQPSPAAGPALPTPEEVAAAHPDTGRSKIFYFDNPEFQTNPAAHRPRCAVPALLRPAAAL
jgi:hypothetical protein